MKRLLLCAALLNLTACPELAKLTEPDEKPAPCIDTMLMIAPPTYLKLRVSKSLLDYALLIPTGHQDYYINLSCESSPPYHGATKVYCANSKIINLEPDFKEITYEYAHFLRNEDRTQPEEISVVDSQGNLVEKIQVTLKKSEKLIVYQRGSSCDGKPVTATETTYSGDLLD